MSDGGRKRFLASTSVRRCWLVRDDPGSDGGSVSSHNAATGRRPAQTKCGFLSADFARRWGMAPGVWCRRVAPAINAASANPDLGAIAPGDVPFLSLGDFGCAVPRHGAVCAGNLARRSTAFCPRASRPVGTRLGVMLSAASFAAWLACSHSGATA